MDEFLLHFIWENRYFNSGNLQTTDGQGIEIVHHGIRNTNQGPDFLHGRIRIDNALLIGHIELHVQSSDWLLHGHQADPHYKNIILHVVWNHDKNINLPFPTLELKHCVAKLSLTHYQNLKVVSNFIPCEKLINPEQVKGLNEFYDVLVKQRLIHRSSEILKELHQKKGSWEHVAWLHIARFLGGKQNGEAMEILFSSIPFEVLMRLRGNSFSLESALFGQAGLLHPELHEEYPAALLKEYVYLKHKFKLSQPHVQWMFFRMRPANFPTRRIAQLSALLSKISNVMSEFITDSSVKGIESLLCVDVTEYWKTHFRFGHQTKSSINQTSKRFADHLIINALVPLLHAYGSYHQMANFESKALNILEALKPEDNVVTKGFVALHFSNANARDSQALLQLYASCCKPKKCLACNLGIQLLKEAG